jgi:hypothetical protein
MNSMERGRAGRKELLHALRTELAFFDAGGYGSTFRSDWRPTLLLRDSPVCLNYSFTGKQYACSGCPFSSLVPQEKQDAAVPCHNIPLDACGDTISESFKKSTQRVLDQRYRDWLCNLIQEFERP